MKRLLVSVLTLGLVGVLASPTVAAAPSGGAPSTSRGNAASSPHASGHASGASGSNGTKKVGKGGKKKPKKKKKAPMCVPMYKKCIEHILDASKPPPEEEPEASSGSDEESGEASESKQKAAPKAGGRKGDGKKPEKPKTAEECDQRFAKCATKAPGGVAGACKKRSEVMTTFCGTYKDKNACKKAVAAGTSCKSTTPPKEPPSTKEPPSSSGGDEGEGEAEGEE